MTSLTITPQAALAPTTPSVELSQQGLNLSKVVVPTAQILEGLQGAAGKDGSKRVVPFEELQAAAHKLGYGVTEADAKKHGLVDGSKPTTLGKFVEVTKQEGLKNKADGVLNYILHPQDTADKVINKLNEVRADAKEAGIKKGQELAQAPGKNYDPNPVTAIAGVFVETGARVGSAAVAGGLGLVSVVVHPVDSVTAAAKALLSPIDTAGKAVDWYKKAPAAEIGEGVLGALVGVKGAGPVNAVVGSAVRKVAAVPTVAKVITAANAAAAPVVAAVKAHPAAVAVATPVAAAVSTVIKAKAEAAAAVKKTLTNAKDVAVDSVKTVLEPKKPKNPMSYKGQPGLDQRSQPRAEEKPHVDKPANETKPNKVADESRVNLVDEAKSRFNHVDVSALEPKLETIPVAYPTISGKPIYRDKEVYKLEANVSADMPPVTMVAELDASGRFSIQLLPNKTMLAEKGYHDSVADRLNLKYPKLTEAEWKEVRLMHLDMMPRAVEHFAGKGKIKHFDYETGSSAFEK